MSFLRDDSGQLVITRPPETTPATATPGTVPAKILRETMPAAPRRAATQHCRFFCPWCGTLILLTHDRIGLPFGVPYLRKLEARSIAAVCTSCNHVNNYSLFRGIPGFDTRHGLVPAEPRVEPVLVDWLKCQEPSCEYPLPLFLLPAEPLCGEMVHDLAMTWHWNDLTCASGHRILAPLWIFGRAPYKLPDPIA